MPKNCLFATFSFTLSVHLTFALIFAQHWFPSCFLRPSCPSIILSIYLSNIYLSIYQAAAVDDDFEVVVAEEVVCVAAEPTTAPEIADCVDEIADEEAPADDEELIEEAPAPAPAAHAAPVAPFVEEILPVEEPVVEVVAVGSDLVPVVEDVPDRYGLLLSLLFSGFCTCRGGCHGGVVCC